MLMLQERSTCPTSTSGATRTPTCWGWCRFVLSPSVNSPRSMQSLNSLRTCPIHYTTLSSPRQGIRHSQGTLLRTLGTGHSQDTHHNKPLGTLLIQLQDILPLEDIHQHLTQGILQEVGATHHILQQPRLEQQDQEQLPASVQNTSRPASSLLWRTR